MNDEHSTSSPEPDWHAKYLALGTAISAYLRVCDEVDAGKADGKDYWTAYAALEKLVGEALCWRDMPEEYAAIVARQAAARARGVAEEAQI